MSEIIQQFPFLTPLLALLPPALFFGGLLGYARDKFRTTGDPVVDEINNLLPQTQCAQCGYPGCRPYAEAIARGDAINKCPPGGEKTIRELADLLDLEVLEPDPEYGTEEKPVLAVIREDDCIGCAKCIPACPVDAIVGSAQLMHTVIASECTGCGLCVEPCPVDCIDIIPSPESPPLPPVPVNHNSQACIRCGLCETACPVDLLPQQLYWFVQGQEEEKARDQKLMDCIDCGLCNIVCPSKIPLVQHFRRGKAELRQIDAQRARASQARERFDFHQIRLQREAQIADQRRRERAALAQARLAKAAPVAEEDPIQAALARVKARQARQNAGED